LETTEDSCQCRGKTEGWKKTIPDKRKEVLKLGRRGRQVPQLKLNLLQFCLNQTEEGNSGQGGGKENSPEKNVSQNLSLKKKKKTEEEGEEKKSQRDFSMGGNTEKNLKSAREGSQKGRKRKIKDD